MAKGHRLKSKARGHLQIWELKCFKKISRFIEWLFNLLEPNISWYLFSLLLTLKCLSNPLPVNPTSNMSLSKHFRESHAALTRKLDFFPHTFIPYMIFYIINDFERKRVITRMWHQRVSKTSLKQTPNHLRNYLIDIIGCEKKMAHSWDVLTLNVQLISNGNLCKTRCNYWWMCM